MFRKLQSLSEEFTLRHRFGEDPEHPRLEITSVTSARTWLRAFAGNPMNVTVLRSVLCEEHRSLDVSRLDDDEVLELLAPLVADESIEIARVLRRSVAAPGRGDPLEETVAPAAAPRKELTWIAIELVTDSKPPKPVPYARYRVEIPDGSIREGILDSNGRARIADIDPGNCLVSFPAYHADDWKKA